MSINEIIIALLLAVVLAFLIARFVVRMIIRLVLYGVLLLVLLAGGLTLWWYTGSDDAAPRPNANRRAPARPARSPR